MTPATDIGRVKGCYLENVMAILVFPSKHKSSGRSGVAGNLF